MKHFESFLAPKLDDFFAYRKDLGYSLKTLKAQLFALDRYLKQTNADWDSLQPAFFLQMRSGLPNESRTVNRGSHHNTQVFSVSDSARLP